MVGSAEAFRLGFFSWYPVAICLTFSLLVQIATNMANDYYDYVRGADTEERVGPERLVASGRIEPKWMLYASLIVFGLAFAIGLLLVSYRGWELLPVGVLSIVFGYGYTGGPYPLAYRGLGDVFVVFFFGLVATGGTIYVLIGTLPPISLLLGLSLGLLANNILVVNNYRDLETDMKADKRTLVVRFGRTFGRCQYAAQFLVAMICIVVYSTIVGTSWTLLPLLCVPLGVGLSRSLAEAQGRSLNSILARSAALVLIFGVFLALGLGIEG